MRERIGASSGNLVKGDSEGTNLTIFEADVNTLEAVGGETYHGRSCRAAEDLCHYHIRSPPRPFSI
jgi:hypothetical protein